MLCVSLCFNSAHAGTINYGELMQTVQAFAQVSGAFSTFQHVYVRLSTWGAVVRRLTEFQEVGKALFFTDRVVQVIEQAKAAESLHARREQSRADELRIEGLSLTLPDGRQLLDNCSITLRRGEHVRLAASL